MQGLAFGQPYLAIGQRLEGPTTVNIKGRSNEQVCTKFPYYFLVNGSFNRFEIFCPVATLLPPSHIQDYIRVQVPRDGQ